MYYKMTNELSMKELLEQQEQQLDKVQVGELITSSITQVSHGAVIISLECGFDGVIALDDLNIEEGKEIADVYKVGDEISAVITKVSPKLKKQYKEAYLQNTKLFNYLCQYLK